MSLRERVGCWLHERWRTELALRSRSAEAWRALCNRDESLLVEPSTGGYRCLWEHSSHLTVARVFPQVSARLFRRCAQDHRFEVATSGPSVECADPSVSVLVAIGGSERLAQFDVVLASLLAQDHGAYEIVVVEQGPPSGLAARLPAGVRHIATDADPLGFNKSWALNVGAAHARGDHLLVHDADYVVPVDYVRSCERALADFDAVRPCRFLFHATRDGTARVLDGGRLAALDAFEFVVQNNPTPIAIRTDVYWRLGGHDEGFSGWGGEDVEFLDRVRSARVSEAGWLPVIHLWHPAAPKKASGDRNLDQQRSRLAVDRSHRVEVLRAAEKGRIDGPVVGFEG